MDIRNHVGSTPLHEVVTQDDDSAHLLVECGASVNIRNHSGGTAIDPTIMDPDGDGSFDTGEVGFLLMLKKAGRSFRTNRSRKTALHIAAQALELDFAEALLDKGIDVAERDNHGWTALHLAAKQTFYNNKEMINLLVERSADHVTARDNDGDTALDLSDNFGSLGELLGCFNSD